MDEPINLDRLQRLSDFWNWLPAFRAVAETEHVRTAAERLDISPSALSRSVGLLEEALGHKLFDREGRGIKLNRAGHEFLMQLRSAMRLIDDGVHSLHSTSFVGALRLCAPDDLMGRLWKGLRVLRDANPDLTIELHNCSVRSMPEQLLSGALDLAFNQRPQPADGIVIEPFMESSNAVYCGTNHELAARTFVNTELVMRHAFVAGIDGDGIVVDGWPPALRRKVVASVPRLQAAVEACAFGGLLACLPVHVAEPYCERGLLVRVPISELGPSMFFVARRTPVNDQDRHTAILEVLRRNLD